jgi:uncharacterized protein YjiK
VYRRDLIAIGLLALVTAPVGAVSLDLSRYQLVGNHALDTLGDVGLEASAVTYARDRGSLFFVGDEGLGVVEISRTGQTLGLMQFSGWPVASTNNDAEGLTYLGGGVLVVAEERLQDAYRFTYVAGGSVNLATADWVSFGASAGNLGTEGISVDPRDGRFFTVKQNSPQAVLSGNLSFASDGGASSMSALFDPSLLGLSSLSDIQTLSPVDALAGTPAADHLLVLSLDSRRLVEVDRTGQTISSLDLSNLTPQALEGVTVDETGVIYLVAEDSGYGQSRLFVLAPVPEPGSWVLLGAGLGIVGWMGRRRRYAARP